MSNDKTKPAPPDGVWKMKRGEIVAQDEKTTLYAVNCDKLIAWADKALETK